jgi:methionyl-tRNA synthetase
MDIFQLQNASYARAYGILCAALPGNKARAGLYPTFCRIPQGGRSKEHSHFENEIFYILRGSGQMQVLNEVSLVKEGDLIRIPPFAEHELVNLGTEDLEFLSVYSEDFEIPTLPRSVVITAAPPTPNGPLHLGHIGGPYLAADVMSRYLRLRGVQGQSHSGTDDHQNYVAERALSLGLDPEAFRSQMRSRIQNGFRSLQISFDEFIEPRRQESYQKDVVQFAQKALERGVIVPETLRMPYCADCDFLLVDSLIEGHCPECAESSRGGCESCGIVVPPQDLLQPCCTRCQRAATVQEISVFTFHLSRYLPLILEDLKALQLPDRLRELVARVERKQDLKILVAYPRGKAMSESSAIQWKEKQTQLHVWFEMAAHYEQFAAHDYWIHSFGFDNGFYYLMFIPALLRALSSNAKLPKVVLTNEFLLLEGAKFSTSRGHAIWADEFDGNTDHLRLFLSLQRPSVAQSNFVPQEFQRFSKDLASQLQSFMERGKDLSQRGEGDVSTTTLVDCNRHTRDMELYYSPEGFNLRRAARQILTFSDLITQSFKSGRNERALLVVFATTIAPLMPQFAKDLLAILGEEGAWLSDWAAML